MHPFQLRWEHPGPQLADADAPLIRLTSENFEDAGCGSSLLLNPTQVAELIERDEYTRERGARLMEVAHEEWGYDVSIYADNWDEIIRDARRWRRAVTDLAEGFGVRFRPRETLPTSLRTAADMYHNHIRESVGKPGHHSLPWAQVKVLVPHPQVSLHPHGLSLRRRGPMLEVGVEGLVRMYTERYGAAAGDEACDVLGMSAGLPWAMAAPMFEGLASRYPMPYGPAYMRR